MPLDIGVGVLLSLAVSAGFGIEPSALFIVAGVVFALLPDLDILPFLWPTAYNHRSFLHYPLSWVAPVTLVYLFVGPLWGTLFLLCVTSHFIHDTIGIGWGIAWLAPFSPRKFLFPEKGRRQQHGFFMTWLPEEEKEMASEHHDPYWVKTFYFRPNPIAYVEYGVLLIAILALWLYGSAI